MARRVFSAATLARARQPQAAQSLMEFLLTPKARRLIAAIGMELVELADVAPETKPR